MIAAPDHSTSTAAAPHQVALAPFVSTYREAVSAMKERMENHSNDELKALIAHARTARASDENNIVFKAAPIVEEAAKQLWLYRQARR